MPKPRQRTNAMKRHLAKLPSGSGLTTHYRKRRAKASHCSQCGRIIFGVPIQDSSEISRLSVSEKRPQRAFGGQLCHLCLRESLKRAVRGSIQA